MRKMLARLMGMFGKKAEGFDKNVFFQFASGDEGMRQFAVTEHYRLLNVKNQAYLDSRACKFMREITATVKDPLYLSTAREQFLCE